MTTDYYAFQTMEGHTKEDGTIEVFVYTNDNLDLGYPNERASWDFICKTKEAFIGRCGNTRFGCSGIMVTVTLDGKKV